MAEVKKKSLLWNKGSIDGDNSIKEYYLLA